MGLWELQLEMVHQAVEDLKTIRAGLAPVGSEDAPAWLIQQRAAAFLRSQWAAETLETAGLCPCAVLKQMGVQP
jgi:hypothetical protein